MLGNTDMTMELEGESFESMTKLHMEAVAKAASSTVRRSAGSIKRALRKDTASGVNEKIARAWKVANYPRRGSALEPASIISSKFKHMNVFEEGATIRAKGGKWLSIPTQRVGYKGNARLKPKDYPRGSLTFILKDNSTAFLVIKGRGYSADKIMFVLKRTVRIKRRLRSTAIINTQVGKLPNNYLRTYGRELKKLGLE